MRCLSWHLRSKLRSGVLLALSVGTCLWWEGPQTKEAATQSDVKLILGDLTDTPTVDLRLVSRLGLFDTDFHRVTSEDHWKNLQNGNNHPATVHVDPGVSASELMRAIYDLRLKGGFQSVQVIMKRPDLARFRQITHGMSIADIFRVIGYPDLETGSGLQIMLYTLDDGSTAIVSYGGAQSISITHATTDGRNEQIEVK